MQNTESMLMKKNLRSYDQNLEKKWKMSRGKVVEWMIRNKSHLQGTGDANKDNYLSIYL